MSGETDEQFDARWALKFLPQAQRDLNHSLWTVMWKSAVGVASLIILLAYQTNLGIIVFLLPAAYFVWAAWDGQDLVFAIRRVNVLRQWIAKVAGTKDEAA